MSVGAGSRAIEMVARQSYGRLLATLASRSGRLADAEDALGDAVEAALTQWPRTGVPDRPEAWLLAVARRRLVDRVRRAAADTRASDHLLMLTEERQAAEAEAMPDRRLGLMLACAHPRIDRNMHAPLMLQSVLGLPAGRMAPHFLMSETAMAQRLVRAKARIAELGLKIEEAELPQRPPAAVADAIYAAFTVDWAGAEADAGGGLAVEAIWLARVLASLVPDDDETQGLLALMLHVEARRPARRNDDGSYVPLDEQDPARWDRTMIEEAETRLRQASRRGETGRYQLEAAIQSAHVASRLAGIDTRADVLALYDHLVALSPSPVIALNRALALSRLEGAHAGLAVLDGLEDDARMRSFQPFWSARAYLCAEAGRREDALDAYRLACGLTADRAVRRYLQGRMKMLIDG